MYYRIFQMNNCKPSFTPPCISIHFLLLNFILKTGSFSYVFSSLLLEFKLIECRNSTFYISSQIRKQYYSYQRPSYITFNRYGGTDLPSFLLVNFYIHTYKYNIEYIKSVDFIFNGFYLKTNNNAVSLFSLFLFRDVKLNTTSFKVTFIVFGSSLDQWVGVEISLASPSSFSSSS